MRRHGWAWAMAGLVALAAIAAHLALYEAVNPTAALEMRVFREEATEIARAFLKREEIALPPSYRHVTTFYTYEPEKAYLEQTLGLEEANRVLQREGFVYRWGTRSFEAEEYEEFLVEVDPDGRVLAYWRDLPDDAPAPDSEAPREVAEEFIRRVAGLDVSTYALQDSSEEPRPNRTDYGFTWERRDLKLGEARQRVTAVVTGGEVIYYDRFLWIPESFEHEFDKQQEKGNLLAGIAGALSLVLGLVALVAIVQGLKRRTLRWRPAVPVAAIVVLVALANDLNALPLAWAYFDVTQTEFSFLLEHFIDLLLSRVGQFLGVLGVVAAAEWLFRGVYRDRPPLYRWLTRDGLASSGGRKRLLAGYLLAAAHLGYVTVFYFGASRYVDAWMPSSVPYDDLFSTAVPWAYALLIGVQAAVSEEFMFRVLAISWLRRVLKWEWLAIAIPAVTWGFLHCSYPNTPFYIRGVELTIWGLVLGWVFVRFGVLPSLIAHATFNAVLVGEYFLTSVVWLPRLNFVVVLVVVASPLAAAVWWSRRRQESAEPTAAATPEGTVPATNVEYEEQMQAQAEGKPRPVPLSRSEPAWQPLPRRSWRLGVVGLVVGVALVGGVGGIAPEEPSRPWRAEELKALETPYVSRGEAIDIAAEALAREKADVRGWLLSTSVEEYGVGESTGGYLEQFLEPADVDELAARMTTPGFLWAVKWQKPLARDAWVVRVQADGGVWDAMRLRPEEAKASSSSEAEAKRLASEALQARLLDLSRYELTGSRTFEHPERTAHYLTWEPKTLRVGEAQFMTEVSVEGGRVNWVERYITEPDSYSFEQAKEGPLRSLGLALTTLLGAALFLWFASTYLRAVRSYEVDWRSALKAAVWVGALAGLLMLLAIPNVWADVPETVSPAAYLVGLVVGYVVVLALLIALLTAVLGVGRSLWQTWFPDVPGPGFWWRAAWRPLAYARVWREAVLAQIILAGIVLPLMGLGEMLTKLIDFLAPTAEAAGSVRLPPWVLAAAASPAPSGPLGIQCLSPGVTSVAVALTAAGGLLLLWVALVPLAKQMFRGKRAAIAWLVIAATSSSLVAAADWREAVLGVVMVLLSVCGLWAVFVYVLRWNPLAVFAGSITIFLAGSASDLLWFPAHRAGAIALYAVAAIIVLWAIVGAVVAWRRGPEVGQAEVGEPIASAIAPSAAEYDGCYGGGAGEESGETETQPPGDWS